MAHQILSHAYVLEDGSENIQGEEELSYIKQ